MTGASTRARTQDRRADTRERDLEEDGRKKSGGVDPAEVAAELSAEMHVPLGLSGHGRPRRRSMTAGPEARSGRVVLVPRPI